MPLHERFRNCIDISWPVTNKSTSWDDGLPVVFDQVEKHETSGCRVTVIKLSVHTGTHVDSPSHFLRDGHTSHGYKVEDMIGRGIVLDFSCPSLSSVQQITRQMLEPYSSLIKPGDIVILKTRNSNIHPDAKFTKNFVGLAKCGAEFLCEKHVKCVGIDYIGIERGDLQPGCPTHHTLLKHHIPVIEGLRLAHVRGVAKPKPGQDLSQTDAQNGIYMFVFLPIKLQGLDGAPGRAVLLPWRPKILAAL